MASNIILKKSSVAARVPATGDLAYGELALNYADGKLYYKKADNTIDSFLAGTSGVSSFNTRTGAITLSSGDVTGALGFTPYDATNPNGYITSSGSISGNAATATTATNVSGGTASVSTLSASGAVTLSGGTAGGVAYLNGSKVLTSGSSLTFDGAGTFQLNATGNAVVNLDGSGQNNAILRLRNKTTGNLAGIFANDVKQLVFEANGAVEQMRLTSTGLGIGTSSPGYKLTVAGTSGSAVVSLLETGVRSWGIRAGGTATNTFDIADFTAGVTRLTLDSSGNLGLGVTPSAWNGLTALQLPDFGTLVSKGTTLWLGSNFYYASGTNYYSVTGEATKYINAGGQHLWYTAPSGTAGNAISFTQAMTLTVGGNLLIGTTTSAGYKLEVSGVAAATDFNSTSDRTKKTNITTIPNALEKVQKLRGVEFDWLDTGEAAVGLIAQEVAEVIPQVVRGESGNMTLSYGNLVGLLIEAVKAQQQQISELQTAVAKLTKE